MSRAKIMDGRIIAEKLLETHINTASEMASKNVTPTLRIVMVGEEPASKIFVRNKLRYCRKVGVEASVEAKPESIGTDELIQLVESLNEDPVVNGILVQLPLPAHIDVSKVLSAVDPCKDVDGLTPSNLGRIMHGEEALAPCGAKAVVKLLEYYGVDVEGADVCIVSNSILVGKPLSILLTNRFATVSVCHAKTRSLEDYTSRSDILISGTGVPRLVKSHMVRRGAVVVDVGISRVEGRIVGDVDFEEVSSKASMITPVPGGVGPVTVAMVVENLFQAMKIQGVV